MKRNNEGLDVFCTGTGVSVFVMISIRVCNFTVQGGIEVEGVIGSVDHLKLKNATRE